VLKGDHCITLASFCYPTVWCPDHKTCPPVNTSERQAYCWEGTPRCPAGVLPAGSVKVCKAEGGEDVVDLFW